MGSYCAARDDPLAHQCVKGRGYGQNTAQSYCDQATAELVGQCGLMTDEPYDYYYFQGTFNIYSRYVGEERGLPRSHDPNTT